jgi:hypothetical protein
MSVPSLAATQMVRIWELRASIECAAHLIPEAAADSNFLLRFDSIRFDPRYFKGGMAC